MPALNLFGPLGLAIALGAAALIGLTLLARALRRRSPALDQLDPASRALLKGAKRVAAIEAKRDRPDELERLSRAKKLQVAWVLVPTMICSGTLTFLGNLLEQARFGGLSFETTLSAAMIAIVISTLQWTSWNVALGLTPLMRSFWRKLCGFLIAVLLLVWTFNTSSLYNFMSLTSTSSLSMRMFEETENRRAMLEGVSARARASKQLEPFVSGEAAYYCPLAERESQSGILSGSRGGGVIAATLTGLCLESQNAERLLKASMQGAEALSAKAATALSAMSQILAATDRQIFLREREWRQASDRLDETLRALRAEDMLASIETWVRALKASVQAMPTAGGALGETQKAALTGLRARLDERIPPIEALVAELRQTAIPAPPREAMPTLSEVTWAYMDANLPALAVACGVDSAVFVLFLFFLLAQKPRRGVPRRGAFEALLVETPGLPQPRAANDDRAPAKTNPSPNPNPTQGAKS